jgi:hypothetical protein
LRGFEGFCGVCVWAHVGLCGFMWFYVGLCGVFGVLQGFPEVLRGLRGFAGRILQDSVGLCRIL